ncbi:hypothetical protein SALBM311S_06814 [Streptomyces alboniger]
MSAASTAASSSALRPGDAYRRRGPRCRPGSKSRPPARSCPSRPALSHLWTYRQIPLSHWIRQSTDASDSAELPAPFEPSDDASEEEPEASRGERPTRTPKACGRLSEDPLHEPVDRTFRVQRAGRGGLARARLGSNSRVDIGRLGALGVPVSRRVGACSRHPGRRGPTRRLRSAGYGWPGRRARGRRGRRTPPSPSGRCGGRRSTHHLGSRSRSPRSRRGDLVPSGPGGRTGAGGHRAAGSRWRSRSLPATREPELDGGNDAGHSRRAAGKLGQQRFRAAGDTRRSVDP